MQVATVGRRGFTAGAGVCTIGAVLAATFGATAHGALGAAAAPSVTSSRACYVNTSSLAKITITGAGWTPGHSVQLVSSDLFATATVAADGTFTATTDAPPLITTDPAAKTELVTVTDQGDSSTGAAATGQSATSRFQIANLAVATRPQQASPRRRVTFRFSGFAPGRPVYAHYVHSGRVVATQRFGRATGACGLLQHRALLFPGGHPRYSSYTVQFDDAKRYRTRSMPKLVSSIVLFRT